MFPTDLSAVTDNVDDVLAAHLNNLEAKIGIDESAVVTSLDYYRAFNWNPITGTFTYASATTINISAGGAGVYSIGDKIRFQNNDSGTWLYAYVVTVADELLTVIGDTVPNATLTDAFYSKVANPQGFTHWFDYSPDSSVNITVGNGAQVARFCIKGKTCHVVYRLEFGSTTVFGADFQVGLPVTVKSTSSYLYLGTVHAHDIGTIANSVIAFALPAVNTKGAYCAEADFVAFSSTNPFTWATGDILRFNAIYEIV